MSDWIRKMLRGKTLGERVPWLSDDPAKAVEDLRKAKENSAGSLDYLGRAGALIDQAAYGLIDQMNATGAVPKELLDFYAAKGVPTDTLVRLQAGELPMDDASRMSRAVTMGLDPEMVWSRYDLPALDQPRLQHRGGLTYAGFAPQLADYAAVSKGQYYPLIGPPEIIGLRTNATMQAPGWGVLDDADRARLGDAADRDHANRNRYLAAGATPQHLFNLAESRANGLRQSLLALNDLGGQDALANLQRAASKDGVRRFEYSQWAGPYRDAAPGWRYLESATHSDNPLHGSEELASQIIQDKARAAGAKGTLAADEASVSVAFMEPAQLRHAGLSILDPVQAGTPGYMRALVPAAVAAGGAASGRGQRTDATMQPVLGGLTR